MNPKNLFAMVMVTLALGCAQAVPEDQSGIGSKAKTLASEPLSSQPNSEAQARHKANRLASLDQWPQWRGPLGIGVAPHGNPPVVWSEDKNIQWKVAIPGKGHSTPIIWDDHIFLSTAVAYGDAQPRRHKKAEGAHDNLEPSHRHKFMVLAINRRDGSILWQKTLHDDLPHEGTHETGSWASNSPVTDGKLLFAFFGSRGLYCLDFSGKLIWQKDLGEMQTKHGHGEGSSPAIYGDSLIINWDHEGQSFVIALDKHTGKERWKVARDELSSWSTPLVVEHDGKHQVIIAATHRVRAYDLADGKIIWQCGGLSANVVASPVSADGYVYVGSSYEFRAMFAIRLAQAKGDITGSKAVVWKIGRHTPYVPSPLLYGDQLFFLRHLSGVLTCLKAKSGEPLFGPLRLPGMQMVFASPVGAASRVYIVSRNGTSVVIKQSAPFELLATNRLDDSFTASPAVVGDELFLRGEKYLYCIADGAK